MTSLPDPPPAPADPASPPPAPPGASPPEANPSPVLGTTTGAGQRIDEGKGRIFPCESCGADLTFNIGEQTLRCPYCGHVKEMDLSDDQKVEEQDLSAMLATLAQRRREGVSGAVEASEIRCSSCGATVTFTGPLTSSECAYCGSPMQRENVHDARDRVPADGVLPFLVEQEKARANLKQWVSSRWFAPGEFKRRGVQGKFNGVYLPFWTYDAMTSNRYTGERGEHYWVTVGSGKNQRRERRTRWHPASGFFQRFFDDVLVCAATGLPADVIRSLEPWPLVRTLPFSQELLAGFHAQTYVVELDAGFTQAKSRIEDAIRSEVRQRIGGDEQRIHTLRTDYAALTYKHLLLPAWLLAYRYHEKVYQVVVNAATGEVQGQRPYSWVKITAAVLAGAAVVAGAIFLFSR